MNTIIDLNAENVTVGELVAENIRAAEVLKRLGIDFCCNGKQTLAVACRKANVPVDTVLEKLTELSLASSQPAIRFTDWDPDFLAEYIVQVHHQYLYTNLPFIEELVWKVATKHGHRYPALQFVRQVFNELKAELLDHLQKEERILFPYIRELWTISSEGSQQSRPAMSVKAPVACMEHEHDNAGKLLFQLREYTDSYTAPADACNTHRLMLAKLEELESDLMQHIHLENNILFPKALSLEAGTVVN